MVLIYKSIIISSIIFIIARFPYFVNILCLI